MASADETVDAIRRTICESLEVRELKDGVRKVTTPFLDWTGYPVSFFVRPTGEVTDGGSTLSTLRSLRVLDDFVDWPFQEDFFKRYSIAQIDHALILRGDPSPGRLLGYVQGLARLPTYFEPRPLTERDEMFRVSVQRSVKPLLVDFARNNVTSLIDDERRTAWVSARLRHRRWSIGRMSFRTDFRPVADNVMVQVISHAGNNASAQRQHVHSKILPYEIVGKTRKDLELVAVVSSVERYPRDVQALIEAESEVVIDWDEADGPSDLLHHLTRPSPESPALFVEG